MIKLTIGMPTYFDYKGMMMTVRNILENHDDPRLEVLVVDNTPDQKFRETQRGQILKIKNPRYRYVEFLDQKGPAETKNQVFYNANGEYVVCIDSHVMFEKDGVARIIDFVEGLEGNDRFNLYSGPLKHSDGGYSSHFDNVWRNQMQGTWATDNTLLERNEPTEYWATGCGFMLAKKSHWLGFNPHFSGFGGEEGYIHEKYRRAGRKFLVIPDFKWWHCFDDPTQRRSDLSVYSKIRNYVLARNEFGEPLDDVYYHFVSTLKPDGTEYNKEELFKHLVEEHSVNGKLMEGLDFQKLKELHQQRKLPMEDWEWLIEDPISRVTGKPDPLQDVYTNLMKDEKNDLSKHYGALTQYAQKSEAVLDISRRMFSAVPLLFGRPKFVQSYMYQSNSPNWEDLLDNEDVEYQSINKGTFEDVLEDIMALPDNRKVDMVFFKPPHDVKDLAPFIDKLALMANKYIAFHDTQQNYKPELVKEIKRLISSGDWYVDHHSNEQWGLTVISRQKPIKEIVPWYPEDGPGTELKKILESYGLQASENCGCNHMARQMNLWGPEACLAESNLNYTKEFLKNNAKKWFDTEKPSWWEKSKIGWKILKDFVDPTDPYEGLVKLAVDRYNQRASKEETK